MTPTIPLSIGPRRYPRLFEPFAVGKVRLANRLVMLPHGTSMVHDGAITDEDIAYYEARARSGPALLITGAAVVHPTSAIRSRKLVEPYNEAILDGLRRRVDAASTCGRPMRFLTGGGAATSAAGAALALRRAGGFFGDGVVAGWRAMMVVTQKPQRAWTED